MKNIIKKAIWKLCPQRKSVILLTFYFWCLHTHQMVVETVEADIIKCQVSFDSPKEKSTNREGGGGYPNQDHFERFFLGTGIWQLV